MVILLVKISTNHHYLACGSFIRVYGLDSIVNVFGQSLSLLEHLVKNGAERVIEDARDNLHRVRMLSDFNYYEGPVDKGSGGTRVLRLCVVSFVLPCY